MFISPRREETGLKPVSGGAGATIETLKGQHKMLAALLGEFTRKQPSSEQIRIFSKLLLEHLRLEDSSLYPALIAQGATSRAVASGFQKTMATLAQGAAEFIKKWSQTDPAADPACFDRELKGVVSHLGKRIQIEEEKLYPLLAR